MSRNTTIAAIILVIGILVAILIIAAARQSDVTVVTPAPLPEVTP